MLFYFLSGFLFFFLSIIMFLFSMVYLYLKFMVFIEWNILFLNSVELNYVIFVDWMSLIFIFLIFFISSMIMFYSSEYMFGEKNLNQFFYLLYLFIISMILMILSPSMISILLGWDGLGLISFCLVIYYQNYYSMNCGMITILINRMGDVMILMSISMMFILGSWNFMNYNFIFNLLILLILLISFTKSAQFPFSSWLPMAMAAPTPVSSLVHSSTLVTAGIYLLIRFNYLIYKNDNLLFYLMLTGLLTMMMAGISANFEFDMKKIIAYSTLSQLGLMMMIFSIKFYDLAFFHLIIHAMFKSMMFMCSGIFIHMMLNNQDIRNLGMLFKFLPLSVMMFMVSNFSLCGMPFFSGFFSKDKILEMMISLNMNFLIFVFLLFSTMLTLMYSFRLSYYLLINKFFFFPFFLVKDNKIMNFSMMLLMIMSMIFGMIMNLLIYMNLEEIYLFKMEKLMILILLIVFFMIMFFLMKLLFYKKMMFMKLFFGNMWFIYNLNKLIFFPLNFIKLNYLFFDKGWSEFYFKNSLIKMINLNSKLINLNNNFLMMMIFFMVFMYFFLLMI
uniref:NADH:ubiquinone reductase (H(+)-translocating) n=1 Tax=Anastatus dexingensis TaxID=2926466 RepID=A0A9E9BR11_9HYME|nr:NADH dehydrogenase subunit 5 [Anastatus dexingensis]WAJ57474.1 NADH dehydrogenase subunit 5 [Anastatus dexingensis]